MLFFINHMTYFRQAQGIIYSLPCQRLQHSTSHREFAIENLRIVRANKSKVAVSMSHYSRIGDPGEIN